MDRLSKRLFQLNALFVYALLYAPIAVLIIYSFNTSRYSAVWGGFSLEWYLKLFQDEAIAQALLNSLIVAAFSTLIATVIGTMTAFALERYSFRGQAFLDSVLYLPIIIPEIVQAISLLLLFALIFNSIRALFGLSPELGLPTIITGHVVFGLSYVTVVVRARLRGFDKALEEAAMDLGAGPRQTFIRITLPLILPGVLGGALLAFTLSFDNFVITFFTAGPGSTTLPLMIYSQVKRGVTPEINALSTLILIASFGLILLSLILQRRRYGG